MHAILFQARIISPGVNRCNIRRGKGRFEYILSMGTVGFLIERITQPLLLFFEETGYMTLAVFLWKRRRVLSFLLLRIVAGVDDPGYNGKISVG